MITSFNIFVMTVKIVRLISASLRDPSGGLSLIYSSFINIIPIKIKSLINSASYARSLILPKSAIFKYNLYSYSIK
ncbi:hypothetical protein F7308_1907 [Francisella salina]|uniref:Uncharacterized protein n=1 Tax=Francisella salina TaxID=573569 RepID=A0ABM5MCD3_FRAST|nr:hypothetical protein F7308_1907 [Francisella salina]